MLALIAKFRHEETSQDIRFRRFLPHPAFPRFNVLDFHAAIFLNRVPLHPGSREKRLLRNVVLGLAGLDTPAAPDTLVYVDAHAIEMFRRIVSFRGRFGMAFLHKMAEQSCRRDEPNGFFKKLPSIDHLFVALLSGRCG